MHDLRINQVAGCTETAATEKIMDACRANPGRKFRPLADDYSVVFKARSSDSLHLAVLFRGEEWQADCLVDEYDV